MSNITYLLDAYHGTDLSTAKNIVASKTFTVGKKRNDHWLGQGAYFYREDLDQAYIWAVNKIDNLHMREAPAVIYLKININGENFLALNSRRGMNYFKKFIEQKRKLIEEHRIKITSKGKVLRCLLCNLLPNEIKVIQGIFFQDSLFDDEELISDSEVKLAGIQICVRDVSIINNKEMNIVKIGRIRNGKRNITWEM